MLKIALTGGIATGKSYVLDQFRRRGVPCLDADELAHGVIGGGHGSDRGDRRALRRRHPRRRRRRRSREARRRSCSPIRRRAAISKRSCIPRSIARSPAGFAPSSWSATTRSRSSTFRCCTRPAPSGEFDRVIVTACSPETQLARLVARRAERRGRAPAAGRAVAGGRRKRARADFVDHTDGSFEETDRAGGARASRSLQTLRLRLPSCPAPARCALRRTCSSRGSAGTARAARCCGSGSACRRAGRGRRPRAGSARCSGRRAPPDGAAGRARARSPGGC